MRPPACSSRVHRAHDRMPDIQLLRGLRRGGTRRLTLTISTLFADRDSSQKLSIL